jgi:formylglycine-generating enzyme required for sulfatase activity/dienelactone hydrolase
VEELLVEAEAARGTAWGAALGPGTVVGRFELVRELGRGGFGIVYEARDRELGRVVAFKAVRAGSRAPESCDRLAREAEAVARLSHPNIVTLYDVGRSALGPYLILELLHGQTLAQRLELGPLPLLEALRIAIEVASGLAHAHAHGVVHRDLTPGNVFLCDDGRVKVLDLGLAHAFGWQKLDGGTPAYMAPEQQSGAPEDERTDVFALGVMLYRMLANALPFPEDGGHDRPSHPARLLEVREEPGLGELVSRMLERDPLRRPRDAGEVLASLQTFDRELRSSTAAGVPTHVSVAPRRRWRLPLAIAVAIAACALVAWLAHRESRVRWALERALPQIGELVEQSKYSAAFALAEQVERVVPDDPRLLKLWPAMSRLVTIETTPAGAEVYAKEYAAPDATWRHLGRSPLVRIRLPWAILRMRIEKKGFASVDAVPKLPLFEPMRTHLQTANFQFTLDPLGAVPPDMVRVPGGAAVLDLSGLDHLPPVQLGDYFIDRTEVTNSQFKRFVAAGGYRRRELWQQAFVKDGRTLSWEEAVALFRDRTARPGPATWESGDYPPGQGDLPVTGVSWYEAAAYAAFVGKSLPSVYQWTQAAGAWATAQIAPASNFGEAGLAPVASRPGIGPFGTYDMAGNAKEWCWNTHGGDRYILGGAWNEPSYMFNFPDAQSPFARAPSFGFRLVKAIDGKTSPAAFDALSRHLRDFGRERPVGPEVFDAFKRLYAYDRTSLDAKLEAVDDTSERWRKEKVSFAAAYGGERIVAYVFLPRRGTTPFQTVVFFPGASAIYQRSSDDLSLMSLVAPVVSSGRALIYPVYKSTYERGDDLKTGYTLPTASYRDHVIAWSKDLGRSIDYVETRSDLDARRVAFYGVSMGAKLAPVLAAVEDRVRLGILVSGGLAQQRSMPEADPFNFAPHVRQPILMVNGKFDFLFPLGTSQEPLYQLLGSRAEDKRHVVFDSGHRPPNDLLTREVLDWLDRYLGPTQ